MRECFGDYPNTTGFPCMFCDGKVDCERKANFKKAVIHELKTEPEYFKAVLERKKTFEVRINDRDFQVGHFLNLKEYDPNLKEYTGCNLHVQVSYILDKKPFVPDGHVIMGIHPIL